MALGLTAVEVIRRQACDHVPPLVKVLDGRQDAAGFTCRTRGVLRVLIVDDNKDAADSLVMLVEIWGYESRVAYGAAAALEIAAAYRPNVLLLDIALPQMNGCRLAQQLRLRAACAEALLIAITGYADEAHRLLCEEAGFDHFLAKPAAPALVEELLHREGQRLAEVLDPPPPSGNLVVDGVVRVRRLPSISPRRQGFAMGQVADRPASEGNTLRR